MVALAIGFGFWWIYFDLVGRRLPRPKGRDGELAAEPSADHAVDHGGRGGDGKPDRPRPRFAHAGEHGLVARGRRCVGLLALILTTRALADAERLASSIDR